jgi:hypothetical protein
VKKFSSVKWKWHRQHGISTNPRMLLIHTKHVQSSARRNSYMQVVVPGIELFAKTHPRPTPSPRFLVWPNRVTDFTEDRQAKDHQRSIEAHVYTRFSLQTQKTTERSLNGPSPRQPSRQNVISGLSTSGLSDNGSGSWGRSCRVRIRFQIVGWFG